MLQAYYQEPRQVAGYINPHRGEDEYWLLYTLSEGENFQVTGTSLTEYLDTIARGWFTRRTGDREPDRIYPAYMTIVKALDGYDFVIQRINRRNGHEGI